MSNLRRAKHLCILPSCCIGKAEISGAFCVKGDAVSLKDDRRAYENATRQAAAAKRLGRRMEGRQMELSLALWAMNAYVINALLRDTAKDGTTPDACRRLYGDRKDASARHGQTLSV